MLDKLVKTMSLLPSLKHIQNSALILGKFLKGNFRIDCFL